MQIEKTFIQDCVVIKPSVFEDERGIFFESFNDKEFKKITGIETNFVQDNQSISKKGVLRGLHLQLGDYAQAKLIRVIKGEIYDVAVDLRPKSATYGKYVSIVLNEENKNQLYIPKGFAHGFIARSQETIVAYKCDNHYNKDAESGIRFDDKDLHIEWSFPNDELIISAKDKELPSLKDFHTKYGKI